MSTVASVLSLGRGIRSVTPCFILGAQLHQVDFLRRVHDKHKFRMRYAKVERDIALQAEQATEPGLRDCGTTRVKFVLQKECLFGEYFKVTGSDPALGGWDASAAVALEWSANHVWTVELELAEGRDYEYKFILSRIDGEDVWQPGPNRQFSTAETPGSLTVLDFWDINRSSVRLEDGRFRPSDSGQEVQQEPDDRSGETTKAKLVVDNDNGVLHATTVEEGREDGSQEQSEQSQPLDSGEGVQQQPDDLSEAAEAKLLMHVNEVRPQSRTSSECIFQNDIAWILNQLSGFLKRFS